MIIDTHVHYFEGPTAERPHDPEGVPIGHELKAEALLAAAAEVGIDKIVQITPALMAFDNRYALEAAEQYPDKIVGVFGRFDPFAEKVDERLEDFMRPKKMIGIRLTLHQPPLDAWLRDGVLKPFLKAAEAQHVPIQIFAPFLTEDMKTMALDYPGIEFLVDHTGVRRMPSHPDRFVDWKDVIELGKYANIWYKVSYFPEAAPDGEKYPFPTSLQRFRELYDAIGAERMIWGSNYPPVGRVCTYQQSLDLITKECDFLTEADRKIILSENFIRYMKKAGNITV